MKLLVGYTADERGAEAIELASAVVAGTKNASLQIAIVLPAATPFSAIYPGGDHGYESILSAQVDAWAAQALALVPAGINASVVARSVSSIAEGLIELGQEFEAHGIVLGGRKRHVGGFFMPGNITNALLHSSPLAVFMSSPTSLDSLRNAGGKITRLTCFVGDRPGARAVIDLSARIAEARQVKLRVATLVAHKDVAVTAEDLDAHVKNTREHLVQVIEELGIEAQIDIVIGGTIDAASSQLSWQPGDLALLGSSRLAANRRLFIGPKAQRILGNLNVPIGVIPTLETTR
ncbi:universal stress protein UspA [Glutamicibacter uratoxydans]|uniref:Universal stress protein UspA n=1 Tax=Glutamicibacter uratoxydans TaxID=43667 RepID=A0A4Y4DMN8_GLUUR|nr:universal stress protein [Glutamicibacter uratoxydans]GED05857.1 universal stress protein UspA [Glutamicibacter uratoxydans]